MNKAIIAGLIGLAVGATGGYFACNFINKSKIDKAISDGIQNGLDMYRGRQKIIENESKKEEMIKTTGRNINAVPHFSATSVVKDIIAENGYTSKEPEGKPETDDSGLPFDVTTDISEKHNIWDEEEPDDIEEAEDYENRQESDVVDMAKLDPTVPPYEITADQYNGELEEECANGFWDKITLVFFKDNVFAEKTSMNDFQTMSSAEISAAIGNDNIKKMIEDINLNRLFIRNNKLHIDYEIVASGRSYSSVLHEDDEE